jgi:hypothetical protein
MCLAVKEDIFTDIINNIAFLVTKNNFQFNMLCEISFIKKLF